MDNKSESKIYDVRLIEKSIYNGNISPKDLENYLKSLPDDAENAEELNIDFEEENKEKENQELNQEEQQQEERSFEDEISL